MTDTPLLLAIDEGTTSTRVVAFDLSGCIVATEGAPITQHYPQPGWVEHDAAEIWTKTEACLTAVAQRVGVGRIAAIGLTNQRETVVFWDRHSGEPLAPAIVWQDRRSADLCAELREEGLEPDVQAKTGLLLDPYFSGTKIAWAIENWPAVARAAKAGSLAIGTIDSYLLFRLTGGKVHVTDATNAARTLLMDLATCEWDEGMIERLGVPRAALPEIVDCAGALGEVELLGRRVPIAGCAGDQQAAAIGQGCLTPGLVKATYGTGAFVLAQAGDKPPVSANRLLSTVAWRLDGQAAYALEGSIFVAGSAIQWLRDRLNIIEDAAETEGLARSVPDNGGVHFVPAFAGLGAPHWRADARGLLTGLTGGTTRAHIVRACLEAMSQQTADLFDALASDGVAPARLRVDGGMVANDWVCQDLADMLAMTVERPKVIETTALGAAMLAGVGVGLFDDLAAAQAMWQADRIFTPALDGKTRRERRAGWKKAVERVLL
ncbi:glycerol kinase GlpK [Sphingoaurantiacus capsulatus]|uniref:Glycerol kinase GlpK n=1 Tax=Sphingoaurantiacus capsulatus TaxID=1771310 RepID=A0ABV7XDR2_9SPHN